MQQQQQYPPIQQVTYMGVIQQFCIEHGIGVNRRVQSTRGRKGIITGMEYRADGKGGVWVMIDDTPGTTLVKREAFVISVKAQEPNGS